MEKVKSRLIEWGVASQALGGQRQSGDMCLVKLLPQEALVAVVDGLGHGKDAAAAAQIAVETLENYAGDSLPALMDACHEALRQTRGVVMSLASFHTLDNTLTWLGVGNVEGYLLRADAFEGPGQETLLLKAGVVGDQFPRLADSILPVAEGDLLILFTDGVRPGFAGDINLTEPPQLIADRILARHSYGNDDALVLVVRYEYGQDKPASR